MILNCVSSCHLKWLLVLTLLVTISTTFARQHLEGFKDAKHGIQMGKVIDGCDDAKVGFD